MRRKVSITLLFMVLFAVALLAQSGNSQVWAQCNPALSPRTQVIYTEEGALRLTIDPCTGQLTRAEFCNSDLTVCRDAEFFDGEWCIDTANTPNIIEDDSCRPWRAVLPSAYALPAAYSNLRCYYGGRI